MANIKQQIKRIKTNEKRRLINVSIKSGVKTSFKVVEKAVKENNKEAANVALNNAYKKLDMACSKGVYHKNYVARHKSTLAKLVLTLK